MPYSEPSHFVEHPENEIHSDSNIIPYSQYLIESQNAAVQDTNSSAQQDALILSVFEQLSNQVTNCNKVNNDNLIANETLSAELERYKERVKLLEERQNVDLGTREKLIIDDIIREKNAQFADFEKEINNLKQTLSEQSKEKELLTKTFNVFKNESKEKEAKNINTEIALEKKIRPMMYDGNVIATDTNVISIADSEETLMLKKESRSKMLLKQSDPMVLEKKVNTKPIDYAELNRLSEDFGKCFIPQQELYDEQALHPTIDQSASSPVKIEAPRELPKVNLVNTSLKKLKYHLSQLDNVVKKHITPNALTEGEWGFEHTKYVFQNEIIPFLKTLKDIFNVFDKDLLNEKQFLFENDRLLDQIISEDIVNIVVNSLLDENTSVNVNSFVAMNDSVGNKSSQELILPSFPCFKLVGSLRVEIRDEAVLSDPGLCIMGGIEMDLPSTAEEKILFGGNEATKKTQKALLKQQYENFNASRALPSDGIPHEVVWMNKPDFDTMGLDDLYNNFKIVETKVKRSACAKMMIKNLAFLTTSGASSKKCRSPKGVKTTKLNQDSSSKAVKNEDASEKAMCAIVCGFDWSGQGEEEIQANMDLMAFSVS
ncbi:hypothetical protein Tco_0320377 [Tanacetum coccineum]